MSPFKGLIFSGMVLTEVFLHLPHRGLEWRARHVLFENERPGLVE